MLEKRMMKAVVLTRPCEPEEMSVSEIPVPGVRPGWVLVRVRALGINHSEILLRRFEISRPYIKKPIIPGIECVGEIVDPSDSGLQRGQRVMALMGGMGRSFDGSYAEYALLPVKNVFTVTGSLDWTELAAIPETFFTAWGSLFTSLRLTPDDSLLIRGGTSTVGLAALQLAKAIGATVISTTRSSARTDLLRSLGADRVILESETFPSDCRPTKILELIGPATIRQSLRLVAPGGTVCQTGLLGGVYTLKDFDPIKEIPSGVYLTGFYSNTPTQPQIDDMMTFIERASIHPVIARILPLASVSLAHTPSSLPGKTILLP